jgi:hypothetical protein
MALLKIISPRQRIESISYSHFWERTDLPSAGYGPPCQANGDIDVSTVHPCSLTTLEAIQTGQRPDLVYRGIREHHHRYTQPAVGRCVCGTNVILDYDHGDGIDCRCGRIYNMSGQELAPRSQWSEDRSY